MVVLRPILFPFREDRTWALSSKFKINQANFKNWISFLQSNLMEEISPNPEALSAKYLKTLKWSGIYKSLVFNAIRSSCAEVFCKNGALRNFAKLTGKHLCQSLFFNKVADLTPATLLKRRLWHRCFPVSFVKFLGTPFFTEYLWWLLLWKILVEHLSLAYSRFIKLIIPEVRNAFPKKVINKKTWVMMGHYNFETNNFWNFCWELLSAG